MPEVLARPAGAPMLSYFLIALVLTAATHLAFDRRLVVASRWRGGWVRALRVGIALHVLVLPFLLVLSVRARASWSPWAVPLARAVFLDEGFCVLLFVAVVVRDLAWLASWPLRASGRAADGRAGGPASPARRDLLGVFRASSLLAVASALVATAWGHAQASRVAQVRRVPLRVAGLPEGLVGLRVAQISDLHVGPTLRRDTVRALVDEVNALEPDLVVVTGDLVDGFVEQLAGEVSPMADLAARLGVYFVTGNHEYFYRAEEWVRALEALGCTVLLGEHRVLERGGARLLLAGVCDESGGHVPGHAHDLDQALGGAPPCALRVLLAHRPTCAVEASRRGFHVQLSGHLHGGQIFPLTEVLRLAEPYFAGLYDVGGMHLYVNRGAGYWGPSVRLGAPQEVTLIELVA